MNTIQKSPIVPIKPSKVKQPERVFIFGDPGAGKTTTATQIASALKGAGKVGFVDLDGTRGLEYGDCLDLYLSHEQIPGLAKAEPQAVIQAVRLLVSEGATVVVIDGLSRVWDFWGMAQQEALVLKGGRFKSTQLAWAETKRQITNTLLAELRNLNIHLVATGSQTADKEGNPLPVGIVLVKQFRNVLQVVSGVATVMKSDVGELMGKALKQGLDLISELKTLRGK